MTLIGLTAAVGLLCLSGQDAGPLGVGSPAPALSGGTWVKGEAVKEFAKGKTYVLQFWSTWSGPSLDAMPGFNALAGRYKDKATFIGINVWDRDPDPKSTEYVGRVQDWVVGQGKAMDYRVCVDDTSDSLLQGWIQAALQTSIPTVFVVGPDGKLAWIESGVAGLDQVVPKVLAGTFTTEDAGRLHEELILRRKKTEELYGEARKALAAGDQKAAFARLDEIASLDPLVKDFVPLMKFELLAEADEAKAKEFFKNAVTGELKDNAVVLQKIGTGIAMGYTPFADPDYETAYLALERVLQIQKKDVPSVLSAMAEAKLRTGHKKDALELMERACEALERDPASSQKEREAYEKRLEQLKDGLG
ncbi:MAG: redoxin domain-containing protein [Armatimonadetes bacterium]|nr:redoxin domain-containing protein [Armatimonadota bacterium]